MNIAHPIAALRKLLRWLILAGVACTAFACALPAKTFIDQELVPFGMNLPPLDGQDQVDPHTSITMEAVGWGTQLAKAELRDETGKVLADASNLNRITFARPLEFGTRYTVKVTAEREWSKQSETREFSFTTVAVPKLEGPALRMVAPDASVILHFDRPVGEIQATGDLKLAAELDDSHQTARLIASDYAQDKTYPVQLNWKTATGVALPPLSLELTTAPPLTVETNLKGQGNLGLALPLIVTFSEALAERTNVGAKIQIGTAEGQPVAGRWERQGQRALRFTPQPTWPASSTIEVKANPQTLRSERGGTLDNPLMARFSTGSDRRLLVYLDTQQLVVMENGQVVRTFKVSTGKPKTPTVTGNFYIYDRYPHKTMRSDVGRGQRGWYEVENVPYTQFFHKDYAFHGAFWHNNFGHPASHGCVNMATKDHNARWPNAPEDAGWLYRWAALGVPVTVSRGQPPVVVAGLSGGEQGGLENASDAAGKSSQKTKPKSKPAAPKETNAALTPDAVLEPVVAKQTTGTPEATPDP